MDELRQFVHQCKSDPSVLHDPSLWFFKEYLQSLGARIPLKQEPMSPMDIDNDKPENKIGGDMEDEIIESDIELDGEVVEADNDPPQQMGNLNAEVSEDHRDAAQLYKAQAMDMLLEGKLEEAIVHLTEAIKLNPSSAILRATRAGVFLKMTKPNAAIRDADIALQINPDSAKGYKTRGMAMAMLGQWEEAASDLHIASNIDYDDEIDAVLKKVEPNVQKIKEHRLKYERLRKEREIKKAERERQCRRAEAQESKSHDSESLPALQEGTVLGIHSSKEMSMKMNAASSLSRLVILYFTAKWCGPCRYMGPIFTNLAAKYPKVVFLKLDIDEVGDIARSWNVSSVPTFFFVKNGKEIDKVVGADKNALENKVERYMTKS